MQNLKKAAPEDRARILEYLKKDLANCIYLYIDVFSYGVSNENMDVWYGEQEGIIHFVAMRYYTSFQLYTLEQDWPLDDVCDLIRTYDPLMVSGKNEIMEPIFEQFSQSHQIEQGYVYRLDHFRELPGSHEIKKAENSDMEEIARLIMTDEGLGGHYTVEALTAQLIERNDTKSGRTFYIQMDGKIVASVSTYGEADGIAVASGLIIAEEYRGKYLDAALNGYLQKQLALEGKTVYTFYTIENFLRLQKVLKNQMCAKYIKMTKLSEG